MKNRLVIITAVLMYSLCTVASANAPSKANTNYVKNVDIEIADIQSIEFLQPDIQSDNSNQVSWGWRPHPTCVGGWVVGGVFGAAIFCGARPAG